MQVQILGGRWFGRVVILGCIALGLAGCGRKASLDPPSTAAVPPASQTSQAGQPDQPDSGEAGQATEGETVPSGPDRGFILDPLLR